MSDDPRSRLRGEGLGELSAEVVAEILDLTPLPVEGGRWAQTWRDANSSAIYYLMTPGEFSHLHRLAGVELWHFYAGAPVQMVLIDHESTVSTPLLHNRLIDGSRPTVSVPAGVAMGAYTTGQWSLVGTTMAPPYDHDLFELVERDQVMGPDGRSGLLRSASSSLRQHLLAVTHP